MSKILIGIQNEHCSLQAVEYVIRQFSGLNDLNITLVHVLPNLPPAFWDEGHILTENEQVVRRKLVEDWLARQKGRMEPLLKLAADELVRRGFSRDQVKVRFISDSLNVADSLLEEVTRGGYDTLILGRRDVSKGEHFLLGSVTSKVLHKGAGVAVCVVE